MRRLYTILCSIIIIILILVFPGYGGGNPGGGNPDGGHGSKIRIFENSSGGMTYMPDNINRSGIVFADSLSEIGPEYILFVGNNSESVVPSVIAYCYDNSGNKLDTPISFSKEGDNCFKMDNATNIAGGGSSFQMVGTAPGGKAKLIASANGLTKEVEVYIYDSCGTLGVHNGIKLNNNGTKSIGISTERANCTYFKDDDGIKIISNSLFIENCTISDWKEKLRAVKTINDSAITGAFNQSLDGLNPAIYIAKVPGGGYVKLVTVGQSIIWEYAPPGAKSFK